MEKRKDTKDCMVVINVLLNQKKIEATFCMEYRISFVMG